MNKYSNTVKEMQEFWNKKAKVEKAITPGMRSVDNIINDLMLNIPKEYQKNALLLDMGCGEGRLAVNLAQRVKRYIGVDISEVSLDRARCKQAENYIQNAIFCKYDGQGLDNLFKNVRFDIVVSYSVLMHCPKDFVSEFLKDIYKILKMGGYFHFSLPRSGPLERRFDRIPDNNLWKSRWYPEWVVGQYLSKVGFKLVGLPFPGQECYRVLKPYAAN